VAVLFVPPIVNFVPFIYPESPVSSSAPWFVCPRVLGIGLGVGDGVAVDELAYTRLSKFVFQLLELVTVTVLHGTFQFVTTVVELLGAI